MFLFRFLCFIIITISAITFESHARPPKHTVNIGVLNGYQAYFTRYSKHYHSLTWDGNIADLQQIALHKKNIVDLVFLNKKTADQACDLGLLIPLSDDIISTDSKQCNLQIYIDHIALSWNSENIHFDPTWKDFWNITQYPGKRGLQKDAFSALSIALLADGIPYDDVITTLSTPEGILRAFKKLNQLKPYIVWWTTPNEANLLLQNKQVLMTSASILSIHAFQEQYPKSHFKFQDHDTIQNPIVLSIPVAISTPRIKLLYDQLKKYPLSPFAFFNSQHRVWYDSIKQDSISSKQFPVSLDRVFNEWLEMSNP